MWLKSVFGQNNFFYLLVVLLVGIIDQLLKLLSYSWKITPLSFGWLKLVWYENPGIAFSIDLPRDLAIVLAVLTLGVLIWAYYKASLSARFYRLGLVLIMAGGFSNLIDKVFFGFVRDMISISYLPIFNLADIAIFSGIVLIIIGWPNGKTAKN